jgi:hypothetical protein
MDVYELTKSYDDNTTTTTTNDDDDDDADNNNNNNNNNSNKDVYELAMSSPFHEFLRIVLVGLIQYCDNLVDIDTVEKWCTNFCNNWQKKLVGCRFKEFPISDMSEYFDTTYYTTGLAYPSIASRFKSNSVTFTDRIPRLFFHPFFSPVTPIIKLLKCDTSVNTTDNHIAARLAVWLNTAVIHELFASVPIPPDLLIFLSGGRIRYCHFTRNDSLYSVDPSMFTSTTPLTANTLFSYQDCWSVHRFTPHTFEAVCKRGKSAMKIIDKTITIGGSSSFFRFYMDNTSTVYKAAVCMAENCIVDGYLLFRAWVEKIVQKQTLTISDKYLVYECLCMVIEQEQDILHTLAQIFSDITSADLLKLLQASYDRHLREAYKRLNQIGLQDIFTKTILASSPTLMDPQLQCSVLLIPELYKQTSDFLLKHVSELLSSDQQLSYNVKTELKCYISSNTEHLATWIGSSFAWDISDNKVMRLFQSKIYSFREVMLLHPLRCIWSLFVAHSGWKYGQKPSSTVVFKFKPKMYM